MSNISHTPAPWHWWDENTTNRSPRPPKYDLMKLIGKDGVQILGGYGGAGNKALVSSTFPKGTPKAEQKRSIAEDIANANLIAVSPEMYILLRNMVTDREAWRDNMIGTTDYEIALNHNINDAAKLLTKLKEA